MLTSCGTRGQDLPGVDRAALDVRPVARAQPRDARRQNIEEFLGDLLERRSAATASVRYRALRVFYDWLEEEGEVAESPCGG